MTLATYQCWCCSSENFPIRLTRSNGTFIGFVFIPGGLRAGSDRCKVFMNNWENTVRADSAQLQYSSSVTYSESLMQAATTA